MPDTCENCGKPESDSLAGVLREHSSGDQLLCDDCYDKEPVDLIASGYEWTCPECGDLIKEIEIKARVSHCERTYETAPAEHAYA